MVKENDFFKNVYELVKKIPRGKVSTYGMIAKALGSGSSARMVGWALNASDKQKDFIPAHRVVNRQGLLSGKHHFHPPSLMQEQLELEGIKVYQDKIVDLQEHLWDPLIELTDPFL